jgi:hypothetical protein
LTFENHVKVKSLLMKGMKGLIEGHEGGNGNGRLLDTAPAFTGERDRWLSRSCGGILAPVP